MRLTGQKSGETTTSNPTPHQFYIQKKIDRPPRRFNPLILPKNLKRPPLRIHPKLMQRPKSQAFLQKRVIVMEPDGETALALISFEEGSGC